MKTILIVGDDRGLIRLMQIQLKQLGYETFMGMGGKRAIDMAVKELPDLITLDIRPSEMNDLEVERCVRQNPETHAIPILAMTTSFTLQERQRCLQSG